MTIFSFIKYIMIKLIISIFICSYSLMFWVIHLNKIILGDNIFEYLIYCLTHIETLLLFLGIYMIYKVFKN